MAAGKTISYVWGSGGAMKRMDLPSGRQVTYTLTDAGRVGSVAGLVGTAITTYLSEAKYCGVGAPLEWNLSGTTMTEKRGYNAIGQMTSMEAKHGTTLRLRLTMDYPSSENNGNLLGQTVETGSATYKQFYGYDSANRLRVALEKPSNAADLSTSLCSAITLTSAEWCQRFAYDGFGNAWSAENVSLSGAVTGLAANNSAWYVIGGTTVNNRMSGISYDLSGKQLQVRVGNAQRLGEYDGEGRLKKVTENSAVLGEYLYDGDGRRVKRAAGGKTTNYVYGVDGALVAEYEDGAPALVAATEYLLTDHLGSVRAKASAAGTVVARHDYEPFGAEVVRSGNGADLLAQRFTGKERDGETGLDYMDFRYYGGAQGRFMSPDPLMASADVADPQSWNRYVYARNNPLRFTDPLGLFPSPAYNCSEGQTTACLNDDQRRILENSTITIDGKEYSGATLYSNLTEKQQNAFVNQTDRLASIQVDGGGSALGMVNWITANPETGKIADDRIFAVVDPKLAEIIGASSNFTKVLMLPGQHPGAHSSFKSRDAKGNIQFSFDKSKTKADIDHDLCIGVCHLIEAMGNHASSRTTEQNKVRELLIKMPGVGITPSTDQKYNRKP